METSKATEKKLAIYNGGTFNPPAAPLETGLRDRIINDAEEAQLFAKPTDTGEFQIGEEFIEKLFGKVLEVDRYGGKWEDGELDKIRDRSEEDLPEGYELRADVTIMTPLYETITLSLPPSSYKYHFARQVKRLRDIGKEITDVLVEFRVKVVKGKMGTYPVVLTKIVDNNIASTKIIQNDDVLDIKEEDIPF